MARTHPGSPRVDDLRRLARDIEHDRDALVRIMTRLGVPVRHYRTWLGLAGERLGRLSPAWLVLALQHGQPPNLPDLSRLSQTGTLPNGWGYQTFWQYADSGTLPGDQDYFNGATDRLRALALG